MIRPYCFLSQILLCFVLFTNNEALAQPSQMEFRLFSDNSSGDLIYLAPSSISKTGNVVSVWSIQNYSSVTGSFRARSRLSSVVVNCDAMEIQEGAATFYSEISARGKNVGSLPRQSVMPIVKGTAASGFRVLCFPYSETEDMLNAIEKAVKKKGMVSRTQINRELLR